MESLICDCKNEPKEKKIDFIRFSEAVVFIRHDFDMVTIISSPCNARIELNAQEAKILASALNLHAELLIAKGLK